MNKVDKMNNFEDKVKPKVDQLKKKFVRTRKKARALKILLIVLGSILTLVISLDNEQISKVYKVALSVTITAITSIDTLLNYYYKSVQEHQYYLKLSSLWNDYLFYKSGRSEEEINLDKLSDFNDRYEKIRTEFHMTRIGTVEKSFKYKS